MKGALSGRMLNRLYDGVANLACAMRAQVAIKVSVEQVEKACFPPGLLKELARAAALLESHDVMWGGVRSEVKIGDPRINIYMPSDVVVPGRVWDAPLDGGELYTTLRKWMMEEKAIDAEKNRINNIVREVSARCVNTVQLRHFLPCVLTLAASSADRALQAKLESVRDYVAPRSTPILRSELLAECKWANETVAMWSLLPPPPLDMSPTRERVRITMGY